MSSRTTRFILSLSLAHALAAFLGACSVSTTTVPTARDPVPLPVPLPAPRVTFRASSSGLPVQGIWKSTPAVVDLNTDGIPDLVALPRLGTGARVWLGTHETRWVAASDDLKLSGTCGGGVAAADVNRDGHVDLVIADHCDGVFVYLGDGRGRWTAVVRELNAAIARTPVAENEDNPFVGTEDVAIGDVNADGFPDLVVAASNDGGLSVYLGDGTGKVWNEVTVPDGLPSGIDAEPGDDERAGWANRVLLADVDGDSHLDVIASYHLGPRVWRGNGAARWQPFSSGLPSPAAGGLYRALALGDVNGDGRTDLATTNVRDGVEVYVQTAEGGWRGAPSTALSALAAGATAVALGDLDGDGHLDLVAGGRRTRNTTSGLFVFFGDGTGQWQEVDAGLPPDGYPFIWGITLADVNRDGRLDIVVAAGVIAERHPTASRRDSRTQPPSTGAPGVPQLQVWINSGKSAQ
jgi:hypothetical protein